MKQKIGKILDALWTLKPDEIDAVVNFITSLSQPSSSEFEEFWEAYPKTRRKDKGLAKKSWNKLRPPYPMVIEKLKEQVRLHDSDFKYFRLATTWLNKRSWENEAFDESIKWQEMSLDQCRDVIDKDRRLESEFRMKDPAKYSRWKLLYGNK